MALRAPETSDWLAADRPCGCVTTARRCRRSSEPGSTPQSTAGSGAHRLRLGTTRPRAAVRPGPARPGSGANADGLLAIRPRPPEGPIPLANAVAERPIRRFAPAERSRRPRVAEGLALPRDVSGQQHAFSPALAGSGSLLPEARRPPLAGLPPVAGIPRHGRTLACAYWRPAPRRRAARPRQQSRFLPAASSPQP